MDEKNDNRRPLLDIDKDLGEMSMNVKIIISLKTDIENLIEKKSDIKDFNNNIKLNIEDKYNRIKKQIQKFMNKKNYIYNFIRNENIINIDENEENEQLLTDNKKENALQTINKMQNEIKIKISNLEEKLEKAELFKKREPLIEEINKNEIKDFDQIESGNNKKIQKFENNSLLNTKAYLYNEETKELEKISKTIELIKKGKNEMKLILENQGNVINIAKNEQNLIGENLDIGLNQLKKRKDKENDKTNYICSIGCLIIVLLIIIYAIYRKFYKK